MSTTKRKPTPIAVLRRRLRDMTQTAESRGLRLFLASRVAQEEYVSSWKGLPDRIGQEVALADKLGFKTEVRAFNGELHFYAVKRVPA
jgi:hypothetical protein